MWGVRRWMATGTAAGAGLAMCMASPVAAVGSTGLKRVPDTRVAAVSSRDVHPRLAAASSVGAVVGDVGCTNNVLPANDDGSTDEVSLPFAVNFFGKTYSTLWVNNNGNVTFTGPLGDYTPYEINASTPPIIAPFFADVDTRGSGSGLTTYGVTTFAGRTAFCVNWRDVGYYDSHTDKTNDFQLLLVDRSDLAPGDFDAVFNYNRIAFETGDASDGKGGAGGQSAGAGFSNGDGEDNHFFQLPGSLENGDFLDSAPNGLVHGGEGSTIAGRYVFHIADSSDGSVSMAGLSRSYPSGGLGYSFPNQADFQVPSGLTAADAFPTGALERAFTDWSRNIVAANQQSATLDQLATAASGGLCYGMALSAGRFDDLSDTIANGPAGRGDALWGGAGTGPTASAKLPGPPAYDSGRPDPTYNREMISLLSVDWATQYSREISATLQRQHFAYADHTSGIAALKTQLSTVMLNGIDRYDPSGSLSSPATTGLAMIIIQTFKPNGDGSGGHAVLAYSAQPLSGGGLTIDVWDNNFPGASHTFTIEASGDWTYDAVYDDGFAQGTYSMSGSNGHRRGLLSVIPLYVPTNLHYYPEHVGGVGTGSFVDVAPGTSISALTDNSGATPDVEPVASGGATTDAGAIVDFPGDAGQLTIAGDHPSLDVRGADTFMTLKDAAVGASLNVSTNQQAGAIAAAGGIPDLTVARDNRVVRSSGAGGLTFAPDGSVSAGDASGQVSLTVSFDHAGTLTTATLYSGPAPASGSLSFTPQQVTAAEAAAAPPPSAPVSPPPGMTPKGPAGPQTGKTPPRLALSGPTTQKSGRTITIVVTCLNEACTAKVSGSIRLPATRQTKARAVKLNAVTGRGGKNGHITLRLKVSSSALGAIVAALRAHHKVAAVLSVTATDASGNHSIGSRLITLKR